MRITDDYREQARVFAEARVTIPERAAGCTANWAHFGGGNLFRGFHMEIQQELLDAGETDSGILLLETFDRELIDQLYVPCKNRALKVELSESGTGSVRLLDSLAQALFVSAEENFEQARTFFVLPELQMVTFSITEKGYQLKDMRGSWYPFIETEINGGPKQVHSAIGVLAALLYERFAAGAYPIALVSTDNFSHNGDKLKDSVLTMADSWVQNGLLPAAFLEYLSDESRVSFPWSMIDRITPNPAESVRESLEKAGWEGMEILHTEKRSAAAAFANTEQTHYLVIEDKFPAGRPPLEKAGVILTDRKTVDKVERMKVCTCLNPLHTALAVFGCLLGFSSISVEMGDADLTALARQIGYAEGLPVVVDPGILKPADFLREVVEKRLPNPHIPDTPQRIAADTSQKMAIRFGNTIRAYGREENLSVQDLHFIPLTIAAWLRYLLGVDDAGNTMPLSPDPMLPVLQEQLAGVSLGSRQAVDLTGLLTNEAVFGLDLVQAGLADRITQAFDRMRSAPGAVRALLHETVSQFADRI